jgi:flagellar protein FliS
MKTAMTDTDAQTAQRAYKDYLESRIAAAHPVEIIHLLYQVAIDNLNLAINHLKSGDAFARARAVTKAELAVDELIIALDHSVGATFTRTLADLYGYVLRQIVAGHGKKSEEAFREALSILTTLSEGWAGVVKNVCGDREAVSTEPAEPQAEAVAVAASAPDSRYAAYSQGPATAVLSRDWSC